MAEVYGVDNGGVALVATTAKTVLEVSEGANLSCRLIELAVGLDYVTIATPGSVKVELIIATTGTGTAYTLKKINGEGQNRTASGTAKINDTVEPSSVTVIRTWEFIVPGGPLVMQWPLGREGYYLVNGMMGIRVTSSVVANCFANLLIEE